MKRSIDVFEHAGTICKAMKKGILLTARQGSKVNPMTIGWGTIGVEWGKPIFIAYVRKSRYTHDLIEATGEFSVNIPVDNAAEILGYCGSKSGRDVDKVAELGLTLETPQVISVPGIKELPLTLECKVLYKQDQTIESIPDPIRARYYSGPKDTGNYHTAYYAEIVSAYQITD